MIRTKVWAHRGASAYAPENTLEAFQLAVDEKVDGIELDVQLTKDGKVVVLHDETLQRVSDGYGYVKDFSLEELKNLRFNKLHPEYADATIPTLKEVLQILKDTDIMLNIELKTGMFFYEGIEEQVIELVKRYGMEDRVWYSSFNHYSLQKVKSLNPIAKIGVLYSDGIYKPADYAEKVGAQALHPAIYNLQYPDVIKECRQKGVKLHVWTANSYKDIAYCIELGVDALITNYPDRAKVFATHNGDGVYPFENPFGKNARKEFYLFGAGYQGQHFMKRFAEKYVPKKIMDNAEAKWGSKLGGIEIESPNCLRQGDCVVVAGNYFPEIIEQLKGMGITSYYVYDEQCDWT